MTNINVPDTIILNWSTRYTEIPKEVCRELNLHWARQQDFEDAQWAAARHLNYRKALAECKRLGIDPLDEDDVPPVGPPLVLVGRVTGRDNIGPVVQYWKLDPDHLDPNSMWDVMDFRLDGDAIIALIGDDRGWSQHWLYMVFVGWSPKDLLEYGRDWVLY